MMNYKGYNANVEYDDENKIFSGSVLGTKTVITFHGYSVQELEKEFHISVDDYLEWCEEDGIEPEKPYSGKFNIRLTPELHRQAACAAKQQGLSLNSFMEKAVKNAISASGQF